MLLEAIVASETSGLTLSEVEGAAVLYCAPGKAIGIDALVEKCAAMYRVFHRQLGGIDRDSICHCGAC